jgi:branched-chain amino acid transport system permease protein
MRAARLLAPLALVALLAAVPHISLGTHGILPGLLNEPGTLQLLATCLVFGALAMTYDLLFGYTGLLSFGHALYFALGVYLADIAMTKWGWSFPAAVAITALAGILVPLVLGAISLRVGGIAFAMVTLAFAQAGAILVQKNPNQLTGGEEGLGLDYTAIPHSFVGVLNTKNLYWLALAYAVIVFVVIAWATESSPGRVWRAIRENELRVEVLGLRPFTFKLMAFVLSGLLATAGGGVYLLLVGGATPEVTSANFTLTLLVMVVIGGAGTRWGALLGGALYTLADNRLLALAGSATVQDLPKVLRTPLSEPLFVLGTIFILLVFFLPGGIAGLARHGTRRKSGLRLLEEAVSPTGSHGGVEAESEVPASEVRA